MRFAIIIIKKTIVRTDKTKKGSFISKSLHPRLSPRDSKSKPTFSKLEKVGFKPTALSPRMVNDDTIEVASSTPLSSKK